VLLLPPLVTAAFFRQPIPSFQLFYQIVIHRHGL
jgi:hypothetical protein